jgi:mediator of RNA polymerase II transcription subunit 12
MVKKYLSVIDLTTSNKTAEPADEVQLLVALTERLKGIALALTDINPPQAGPKSKEHLLILDINAWLKALLRLAIMHCSSMLRNASQQNQISLMSAMKGLITHPTLEMYPSIADHVFDVAVILSDYIPEDVRVQLGRADMVRSVDDLRCLFILGAAAPVDGWLVLAKPINAPAPNQSSSRPQTPVLSQNQSSPFPPPQGGSNSMPQQRHFNQQQSQQQSQQQRQMQMQSQQSQQMRAYSQFTQSQASSQQNKMLPAQLQRHPSSQGTPSPLQQMQQMQAMQQRATQPSPVYQQRPPPPGSQSAGSGAGGPPAKLQLRQDREMRQYPFVQPRWEILAESSGNPNANDTAISLTLFGARKV